MGNIENKHESSGQKAEKNDPLTSKHHRYFSSWVKYEEHYQYLYAKMFAKFRKLANKFQAKNTNIEK